MTCNWSTRLSPRTSTTICLLVMLLGLSLIVNLMQSNVFVTRYSVVPAPIPVSKFARLSPVPQDPESNPGDEGEIGGDENGTDEDDDDDDADDDVDVENAKDDDDDESSKMKILPDQIELDNPKTVSVGTTSAIEEVQEERQHHLRQVCASMGLPLNKTSPLDLGVKKLGRIFVFPKYKLLYCAIPKVSCTSWKVLFLLLHGHIKEEERSSRSRSISPHIMADRVFMKLSQMKPEAARKALQEYTSFVFVRNPYTKLLSAYNDKIVRLPSMGKWRPLVRHWTLKNRPDFKPPPGGMKNISFDEFVKHYMRAQFKEIHWRDMFELCHPCHVNYNFVGLYETLEADSDYILTKAGVPSDIRLVSDLTKKQTHSSSNDSLNASYSKLSNKVFNDLSKSPGFSRDCELFDYKMPDCLKRG